MGEMLMPDAGEWITFALVALGIGAAIGISEVLRLLGGLSPEFSRKLVHVGVGTGILFAPKLFISPVPLLLLAALFAIVNGIAVRRGWLKSIHGQSRRSLGTVYFPVSLFVLSIFFWQRSPELVVLSMFAFSLGDAGAALVGESLRHPHTMRLSGDPKSYEGSVTMALVSFGAILVGSIVVWDPLPPSWNFLMAMGAVVAVVSAATEAISSRALDNLTVPAANAIVLSVFLFPSTVAPVDQLMMGVGLGLMIAALSYSVRFLTLSGSVATFLLATCVYGFGGWKWTIPMLVFFVFSSALSFFRRHSKADLESVFEKSSTRDRGQVAANGGLAGVLVLVHYAFPGVDLYPAYIGSIAAVTADTWGTEVGILSKGLTVSIVTFREVPRGTSGGVSFAGSFAGVAGAVLIAALGAQWAGSTSVLIAGILGGLVGFAVDSVIGETLQARFRCTRCGKTTERAEHCDVRTDLVGGIRWLRNDAVNAVCAACGACVAFLLV